MPRTSSQQNIPIATVGVSPTQVTLIEMNQPPAPQVLLQQRPCHSMGCPDVCYTRNAQLLMLCIGGFFAVVGFVLGGLAGSLVVLVGMGLLAVSLVCMCSKYGKITDMLREREEEAAALEACRVRMETFQAPQDQRQRCVSCTTPLDTRAGEVQVCNECRAEGVLAMPIQLQDGRQTGVVLVQGAPPMPFEPHEHYPMLRHPQGLPQMGSDGVPRYDGAHQHGDPSHHHCSGSGPWYDFSNAYNVPPPPPYEESPNAVEPKISSPTTTPRTPRYPVFREERHAVDEARSEEHGAEVEDTAEVAVEEEVTEEYSVGGIYMEEEYGGMEDEPYALPPEGEPQIEAQDEETQLVTNVLLQHEGVDEAIDDGTQEGADVDDGDGSTAEEASEESLPEFLATVQAQEAEFLVESACNQVQPPPS